jgi:hypothetical protein
MILIRLILFPILFALFVVLGVVFILAGSLNWLLSGDKQTVTLTFRAMH